MLSRDGASKVRRALASAAADVSSAKRSGGKKSSGSGSGSGIGALEAAADAASLSSRPLAAAEAGCPLWNEFVPPESEVGRRSEAAVGQEMGSGVSGLAAVKALERALELVGKLEARQVEGGEGWVSVPSARGGACLLRPVSLK